MVDVLSIACVFLLFSHLPPSLLNRALLLLMIAVQAGVVDVVMSSVGSMCDLIDQIGRS